MPSLIGTGITLGFVHVLTGPDHLSALATLSANVRPCEAFCLGVRWGLGHSTGLIVVGVIFIALSTGDTVQVPETITIIFEALVGVFMLLLGCFGMVRAWRKRPSVQVDELPLTAASDNTTISNEEASMSMVDTTSISSTNPVEMASNGEESMSMADVGETMSIPNTNPPEMEQTAERSSRCFRACCAKFAKSMSAKTLACGIGIIHGVAGPGGVLGVIPAVQLKDWKLSTLYLGVFCISSTIVMGCYASLYGTCSSKLGKERGNRWEFILECISAALSIIVGILWLTLLALGKLDDVFP